MRRAGLLLAVMFTGGCFALYSYDGYEHAGTGGTGGGGQTCDVGEDKVTACNTCLEQNCGDKLSDCSAQACADWGTCFKGCQCPSCFDGCEEFGKGSTGEQVLQCACMLCADDCAGVKPEQYLTACN